MYRKPKNLIYIPFSNSLYTSLILMFLTYIYEIDWPLDMIYENLREYTDSWNQQYSLGDSVFRIELRSAPGTARMRVHLQIIERSIAIPCLDRYLPQQATFVILKLCTCFAIYLLTNEKDWDRKFTVKITHLSIHTCEIKVQRR